MRRHLVLFVRTPQLGRGKRRLAQEIGDVATVRFERLMLGLLLRRLAHDRRWRLRIAVTPDTACPHARHWRRGVEAEGQGGGDLGIRMHRALAARHIAAAFSLLGRHDLVFGPAEDGGFWLVGARRRPRLPLLFEQVRWSSPHALADTLAGLPPRVSVGFVDRLEDVDDGEAYRRLMPRRGF